MMATLAPIRPAAARGDRFFPNVAIAMVVVMVIGFSTNLLTGRSSFASPLLTHIHAVAFMGWLGLFVVQSHLGAGESRRLHRLLGWTAAIWATLLVPLGIAIVVAMVRRDVTPFFFRPQHLMIADPFTLLGFAGFTFAAIRMRRRTDWHARLHVGAMAMLMGPGVGRILPMPFLGEYAFEIANAGGMAFLAAGAARDYRRSARVHRAWIAALVILPLLLIAARVVAFSPIGDALYQVAVAGSPGAAVDGRAQALHRLPPEMRAAIYGE